MPTAITLTNVVKDYPAAKGPATRVIDHVDLSINPGELFFLLGPSGCGKTTILRMIAGFIEPTDGRVRFGDRDVTDLPANQRNTGMVFQSYALWPHLTVAENVAFGLRVRKTPTSEVTERIGSALDAVKMRSFSDRKPNQLSGGQQQRVALARALVIRPDVLLLDEPLSNLDAKLRHELRDEIRRLCRQFEMTTICVTHDREEAMAIGDRIAVLDKGRVAQVGPPAEVYSRPSSRFVAEFLGEANFVSASAVSAPDGGSMADSSLGTLPSAGAVGPSVTAVLRPEQIRLTREGGLQAEITNLSFVGHHTRYSLRTGELSIVSLQAGSPAFRIGDRVCISVDGTAALVAN
ncbi:MAG: ABC transporter ATP-binding protein [Phycisphaerales bacterium]|jgi:iron(III) transport system ATP-binding protein|nr:ABC transporter ATP-binding protein [Phycisphaerales bacterium]